MWVKNQAPAKLIPPYGGKLVNLLATDDQRSELIEKSTRLPSVQLSSRSLCDLELLASGGFSPLDRFMGRADYLSVVKDMRLTNGTVFPIPITLPISENHLVSAAKEIALRTARNELVAVMAVDELYEWDPLTEAQFAYGTTDARHPLVAEMASWGKYLVSGPLQVIQLPRYYDFPELRLSPGEVRCRLQHMNFTNVVAFQSSGPLYRIHEWITKRAADMVGGALLIHPVVGLTKPGDADHFTRVRAYKTLVDRYYDPNRTLLNLLPLAMRMAGAREAAWHALISRNYGANYFIVGQDHGSPGVDSDGKPFYGALAAQALVRSVESELGIKMIPFDEIVYLPEEKRFEELKKVPKNTPSLSLSGSEARGNLVLGKKLPTWFTRPELAEILAAAHPPREQRGFCVWFTGLPCAGKSTIAEILTALILRYGRQITLLDGDVVRTHLSKGLGYSREDRDANILRIGFVAGEIVRHGGAVICAAVSPYAATRSEVRNMVGADHFIEVFVDTPLAECERRDAKGMYAKARRGEIRGFTGIDDPYERPVRPAVTFATVNQSPEENARRVLQCLIERGFLRESER